jgi:hypothetical protein
VVPIDQNIYAVYASGPNWEKLISPFYFRLPLIDIVGNVSKKVWSDIAY